uniref:Uncharacterized protein n=1 Tax=viral metagenome TaxID=1070528 RepID=A0A6M3XU77_9ZZZZ
MTNEELIEILIEHEYRITALEGLNPPADSRREKQDDISEPKQITIKTIQLTARETGLIQELRGHIAYLDKKLEEIRKQPIKKRGRYID